MRMFMLMLFAAMGIAYAVTRPFKAEPLPRSAAVPSFQPMSPGLAPGSRNNFPRLPESNAFGRSDERQQGFIHQPRGFGN